MGRNSKARRDARRRKAGSGTVPGPRPGARRTTGGPFGPADDRSADPVAGANLRLVAHVSRLGLRAPAEDALRCAASLRRDAPAWAVSAATTALLDHLLAPVLRSSWGPSDVAEAVDRHVGEGHRDVLAGLTGTPGWAAELGAPRSLDLGHDDDLALALRLAALLAALPVDEPAAGAPRQVAPAGSRESAKLAQVRALLAKAEATTFAEEAEALSAKAQELVSRYSLERLLEQGTTADATDHAVPTVRRVWLDAPYLSAKATLVHHVALANRCRAVLDQRLGLCTVVGTPFDLDAVEMLVTSLLTQAHRAMLGHGSATDANGRSRTRSFRQAFLVSFAVHIGERLQRVAQESVDAVGASRLPAIRSREELVHQATERLFPHLVEKATTVSDPAGWAGGRAAAELALLDIHDHIEKDQPPRTADERRLA